MGFPCLNSGTVPIQVVQLYLDELQLRMLRQHPIQERCFVVAGKAHVADFSLCLHLCHHVEGACFLKFFVVVVAHIVEKIVVKILHAAALQLCQEHLFRRTVLHVGQVIFIRQSVAVVGVPVGQGQLHHLFAALVVIHPCGVEISKPPRNEGVHHFLYLFHIDVVQLSLLRIRSLRKTHHSESQLLLRFDYCHLYSLP